MHKIHYSLISDNLAPWDRQLVRFKFLLCVIQMHENLRREVRTWASHCEHSLHSQSICMLGRHLHIIPKIKNTKLYTMDQAATGKTFYFCYLTYGSRTANRTDSLHQTIMGQLGTLIGENPLLLFPTNFQASTEPNCIV